ncbi:MAG: DUF1161 domain-containing protein [Solimonas sp.]
MFQANPAAKQAMVQAAVRTTVQAVTGKDGDAEPPQAARVRAVAAMLLAATGLLAMAPAQASCDSARVMVAEKLRAKGITDFQLVAKPNRQLLADDKVVGNCANETRSLVYRRGPQRNLAVNTADGGYRLLVGYGDSGYYRCDDPVHAGVRGVETAHIYDGDISLCTALPAEMAGAASGGTGPDKAADRATVAMTPARPYGVRGLRYAKFAVDE